jgi:hypothetical protein
MVKDVSKPQVGITGGITASLGHLVIALLLVVLAAAPLPSFSDEASLTTHTYYLSPGGDDSGPGTLGQPWRSPGKAARKMASGDTLILLPGRYPLSSYLSDVIRPPSGKPGSWTTIRGSSGERRAELIGEKDLAMAIDLAGTEFVRIENLEITSDLEATGERRWFREGISAIGEPISSVVLRNLYIHHLDEMGIDFQDADGLEVTDCRIEYCGFGAIGGPEGEEGGWRNAVIEGCRLSYGGHYYRGSDGSDRPYDRPDGIGLEPSDGPVEVRNTCAEHNYGDGIDLKPSRAAVINCVAANNSCDGVKLWGGKSRIENTLIYGTGDGVGGSSPWAGIVIGTTISSAEFEIINVTLHDNPSRLAYPMYVEYDNRDVPIKITMRNCIIAGGHGAVYFGPSVNVTIENNLFYRPGDAIQVEAGGISYSRGNLGQLGMGNIYGDPRFIRTAWGGPGDYQLRKGSPAVDGGSSIDAPAEDIDGVDRPAGIGVDMGAYERAKGTAPIGRPGGLSAEVAGKSIKLHWKDRSRNETGFMIERKAVDESDWRLLGFTDADTDSYVDKTIFPGTTYHYRVFAVAGSRFSKSSRIARAMIPD